MSKVFSSYLFWLCVSFLVVGFFLFRDVLSLSFHGDDFIWLLSAKHDTVAAIGSYFYDAHGFFYRPLTKVYFWFLWPLFGATPLGYHVLNILIHAATSLLVFCFVRMILRRIVRMTRSAADQISFATAILYYVLPAHVENVVWISAITELLPAFFVFCGLCLFLRYFEEKLSSFQRAAIFLSFVCGLFSHEYVVVFPLLVYLTDLLCRLKSVRFRDLFKPLRVNKSFYLQLVGIDFLYLLLRFISGSHWQGGDYSYKLEKLPFNVLGNTMGYLGLNYFGLSFIETYSVMREYFKSHLGMSILFFAVIVVCFFCVGLFVYRWYRHTRTFSLLMYVIGFVIVALLPFLGLGSLAERYLYVPSAMLLLLLVFLLWRGIFALPFMDTTNLIFFWGVVILLSVYYAFSFYSAIDEWKQASIQVEDRMYEFQHSCQDFAQNKELARSRPLSRIGRAWVFQVGYEQGANLYCDKNLKIFTQ
jgi:hypothetical protein